MTAAMLDSLITRPSLTRLNWPGNEYGKSAPRAHQKKRETAELFTFSYLLFFDFRQSRTQSPQAFWSAGRRQERLWDNGKI